MSSTDSNNLSEVIQSNLMGFVPMILIFIVFYVLLIRPQEKKRKEHEELIHSVQKGEEIITHGGIFGKVVKIHDDNIIDLEIAQNTIIKISKNAIADIISREKGKLKK